MGYSLRVGAFVAIVNFFAGTALGIPTITIDDTIVGSVPGVSVNGIPDAIVTTGTGEVIITGSFVDTVVSSPLGGFSISALVTDASGDLTDFATLTDSASCNYEQSCSFTLQFESIGSPNFATVPVLNVRYITETGSFQSLIGAAGLHNVFGDSIEVDVASAQNVPEPSSLLLLSAGFLGVRLFRKMEPVRKSVCGA